MLNGRSVCDRVAEGDTELDDVGTSLLEGEQERDGRVPGGEAGGEERDEDRVVLLLALLKEIAKLLRHGLRLGEGGVGGGKVREKERRGECGLNESRGRRGATGIISPDMGY